MTPDRAAAERVARECVDSWKARDGLGVYTPPLTPYERETLVGCITIALLTWGAGVYGAIAAERHRQDRLKAEGKFTMTCADAMTNGARLAVLGEEFGEVCRAVLEAGIDGEESYDKHGKELRKELIQVAAVCVAWLEGLDADEVRALLPPPGEGTP